LKKKEGLVARRSGGEKKKNNAGKRESYAEGAIFRNPGGESVTTKKKRGRKKEMGEGAAREMLRATLITGQNGGWSAHDQTGGEYANRRSLLREPMEKKRSFRSERDESRAVSLKMQK